MRECVLGETGGEAHQPSVSCGICCHSASELRYTGSQRSSKSLEAAYYKYVAAEVRRMRQEGRIPGRLEPDAPELQ